MPFSEDEPTVLVVHANRSLRTGDSVDLRKTPMAGSTALEVRERPGNGQIE